MILPLVGSQKGKGTFLMKRLSIVGSSNVVLVPGGKGKSSLQEEKREEA